MISEADEMKHGARISEGPQSMSIKMLFPGHMDHKWPPCTSGITGSSQKSKSDSSLVCSINKKFIIQ